MLIKSSIPWSVAFRGEASPSEDTVLAEESPKVKSPGFELAIPIDACGQKQIDSSFALFDDPTLQA